MKFTQSHTWAIGGGKGGVGKSVLSVNLACSLASQGSRVILIDADLAGANIHTLFGISYPELTLTDFIKTKGIKFRDILIQTSEPNLSLICGASDLIEIANPKYAQKQKLVRAIADLEADHIIIDIGAGSTLNNLDFFNTADTGIIVTTTMPTAVQNAYSFLKLALHRRVLSQFPGESLLKSELSDAVEDGRSMVDVIEHIKRMDEAASWKIIKTLVDSRYRLVVNMASEMDGQRIGNALAGLSYQFLRIKLPCYGTVGASPEIEQSVLRMQPILQGSRSAAFSSIRKIAARMMDEIARDTGNKRVEQVPAHDDDLQDPAGNGPEDAGESAPDGTVSAARVQDNEESSEQRPYRASESESSVQLCINEELMHENVRLHVQTEDLGIEKAKVLTLVFRGGHILFSKGADYSEFADLNQLERSVAERVRWQHKAICAGILAGKLDERLRSEGGR